MTEIIPAILSKNYEDMKNRIALVRGVVPLVQIDICDGSFVKNATWPFATGGNEDYNLRAILEEREGMPFWEDIDFELDLMVSDAVENFHVYTKLSPKRIVFHLEAIGNIDEFKEFIEGMDVFIRDSFEIGVAIHTTTPVEKVFPLVNSVDFIQCMGIEHIGFQGQDFDERVLAQIKTLKAKFDNLIISVDGGVDFKSAPRLVDAGATRLVIGSAIFNTNDIIDTIERFREI
jgi:ribulose-phosphate 3-epimerase